jgi:predicted nuclease with RNAse H fold
VAVERHIGPWGEGMLYLGIDVANPKKGQAVAVLKDGLRVFHLASSENHVGLIQRIIKLHGTGGDPVIVAIDAPRAAVHSSSTKWGRECERELHKRGFRLQWTPPASFFENPNHNKEWMEIGFGLFRQAQVLQKKGLVEEIIEVFPSASYPSFPELPLHLPFNKFDHRHKTDQLDAICCALVAWCHKHNLTDRVGNHKEGEIILPRLR